MKMGLTFAIVLLLVAPCARGQSFSYDAGTRLTEVCYDASHSIRYQYDLYDNPTNVAVTAGQTDTDGDADGMADAWELVFFNSLTNTPAADPNQDGWSNLVHFQNGTDPLDPDTDDDGMPNADENRAGTNPRDPLSVLVMAHPAAPAPPGGGLTIAWQSVTGKLYQLERSTNLVHGFAAFRTNLPATPPLNVQTDATAVGRGPYFYRARIP